jgi:hypothetical protein
MIESYDIKRLTTSMSDGVPIDTWTVKETRKMEIRPIIWYRSEQLQIDIGGQKFTPSFKGWIDSECLVTASDRITNNSGSTEMLVLRVHRFEDHQEIDLRELPIE